MEKFRSSIAALAEAHLSGRRLKALPVKPAAALESFFIQDEVAALLEAQIGGWKAGLPEDVGSYRAPMYQSGIMLSPARMLQAGRAPLKFEAEIAFRFGRALPRREQPYEREEVIDALASAHAAIELVESRYGDPAPYLSRLADNQTHGGFIVGPPVTTWRELDLSRLPVRVVVNGTEVSRNIGGNPSGDPLRPVVWLANNLAGHHAGIAAGAYVTTGSTTGVEVAEQDSTIQVEFEGLGMAELILVH